MLNFNLFKKFGEATVTYLQDIAHLLTLTHTLAVLVNILTPTILLLPMGEAS